MHSAAISLTKSHPYQGVPDTGEAASNQNLAKVELCPDDSVQLSLKKRKRFLITHYAWGLANFQQGNDAECEAHLLSNLALAPGDLLSTAVLTDLYIRQKDFTKAEAILAKISLANICDPLNQHILKRSKVKLKRHRGIRAELNGNSEAALAQYRKAANMVAAICREDWPSARNQIERFLTALTEGNIPVMDESMSLIRRLWKNTTPLLAAVSQAGALAQTGDRSKALQYILDYSL